MLSAFGAHPAGTWANTGALRAMATPPARTTDNRFRMTTAPSEGHDICPTAAHASAFRVIQTRLRIVHRVAQAAPRTHSCGSRLLCRASGRDELQRLRHWRVVHTSLTPFVL